MAHPGGSVANIMLYCTAGCGEGKCPVLPSDLWPNSHYDHEIWTKMEKLTQQVQETETGLSSGEKGEMELKVELLLIHDIWSHKRFVIAIEP